MMSNLNVLTNDVKPRLPSALSSNDVDDSRGTNDVKQRPPSSIISTLSTTPSNNIDDSRGGGDSDIMETTDFNNIFEEDQVPFLLGSSINNSNSSPGESSTAVTTKTTNNSSDATTSTTQNQIMPQQESTAQVPPIMNISNAKAPMIKPQEQVVTLPSLSQENQANTSHLTTTAHNQIIIPQQESIATAAHQQQPPVQPKPGFVNAFLIIDPSKKLAYFPKQILTWTPTGLKAVFGPTSLSSIRPFFNSSDSKTNQQPQALPASAIQVPLQQQQQEQLQPMATTGYPGQQMSVLNSTATSSSPCDYVAAASNSQTSVPDCSVQAVGPVTIASTASTTAAAAASAFPPPPPPPMRSLSAYNFFFRDERDRILHGGSLDYSQTKMQQLLSDHWGRDRTVKRRHRKTHGKIDFTTLSKLISQRWKDLSVTHKAFYKEVAKQDWERYQREIKEQKEKLQPAQQQQV